MPVYGYRIQIHFLYATSELSVVLQVKLHYVDLLHRAKYVRIAETIIGLLGDLEIPTSEADDDDDNDENDDEDELLQMMAVYHIAKI